jgi:epoxyqueuosine reductase
LSGDLVFGCDICQEVCPYNEKGILTTHGELLPENGVGELLDLKEVLSIESREEFLKLTAGTPLTRPRLAGLKRSAEIVMQNQDQKPG